MALATGRTGRYRDAFAATEFRALFGAFVVSMLGYVVAGLALTVLVYRETHSPLLSALTFSTSFVPYLFGGTLLSGLVDRVPSRRLLAGCDLGCAAVVALMTVPGLPVPVLFALLFAMSLLTPVGTGARGALVAEVLPPDAVVPARSLLRLVAQGAQICGYAAGGGLLATLSPRAVLGVEVVTFAASALTLRVFLARRPARGRSGGSLAGDSLRGVAEVLGNGPLRRVLLLGWLVPFLTTWPEALAAPSVGARGLAASATGWWLAAMPLGTVAGELAGVWLIPAARRGRLSAPLAACGLLRGVAEVLGNGPLRRVLLLGWLVPFLTTWPEALAAPSVGARGLAASATGWWLAAMPLGTVAGELAGVWLIPVARRGRLSAPLAACGFVPFLLFAAHPPLVPALALLGTAGLCGAYLLGLDQLLLDVTPPELLGRAYAVNSSGLMATQGVGFAAAGALGEVVSPDLAVTIAGGAGLAVVALCRPRRARSDKALGRV